ncbi:MAG: Arm DNA-binding domain-containing protein [Aeromonadaceae bacterium]
MGRVKHDDLVAGVTGLEVHGKKLRINFTYKGVRCREVLDLPITKANVKFAANKLATIKHEIAINTFNYASHFPNSGTAEKFGPVRKLHQLGSACAEFWKLLEPTLKPTTRKIYPCGFKSCLAILGPERDMASLKPKDLERLRNELMAQLRPATVNTYLKRFCQFLLWCERNDIMKDAGKMLAGFKLVSSSNGSPADPLEYSEYLLALDACTHVQHQRMITVSVYTGLRPGELRALAWEDIDFEKRTITVRRSVGPGGDYFKLPKTGLVRVVDMQPPVIEALSGQRELTYSRKPVVISVDQEVGKETISVRPVFSPKLTSTFEHNSGDWFTQSGFVTMWVRVVERSGIRYRRLYQLRHTFASWNLTSHGNLAYIADQMGHADLEMLQSVYGKWIASASKSEAARIWELMTSKGHFAPTTPQENGE